MVYFMLIAYILSYSFSIEEELNKNKYDKYFKYILPVGIALVAILTFQYNVGTDYPAYIQIAEGTKGMGWIERKSEYLFIYLVNLVRLIGIPQLLFFFSALIQVTFLLLIAFEVKKLNFKLHKFFFLYFTLCTAFFSQFNGVRQYIAIYIVTYAFFKLLEDKNFAFIALIIFAAFFHSSAKYFIIFVLLKPIIKKKIPFKLILFAMVGLLILSFFDMNNVYTKIISYTPYSHYAKFDFFTRMPLSRIITKIPKLGIPLFAAYLIEKEKDVTTKKRFLLNMSYISMFVMILSFNLNVIIRIYQYVDIFILFPVLMIFEDRDKKDLNTFIVLILISMLLLKILALPSGEYLYRSILFQ